MASPLKLAWTYDKDFNGYILSKGPRKQMVEHNASKLNVPCEPFISNAKMLTGQACLRRSEPSLSDNVTFGIAELHPSTMELCNIRIGGPILIFRCSSGVERSVSAMKAWPSMSVSPGKISISKDAMLSMEIEENDFINVCKTRTECTACSRLCLQLVSKNHESALPVSSYMEQYLSQVLKQRCFVQNQLMMVEYLGRKVWFTVQCEEEEKFTMSTESLDQTNGILSMDEMNNEFKNISMKDCELSSNNPKANGMAAISHEMMQVFQITNAQIKITGKRLNARIDCIYNDKSDITFGDIGGLCPQIKKLKNLVELPLQQPELYVDSGFLPPAGIILYGVPGTGKTMLLNAFMNCLHCHAHTIIVNVDELNSKPALEGEQKLTAIFSAAVKSSPSLILMDNIELLCPIKERSRQDARRLDYLFSNLLDRVTLFNKTSKSFVIVLSATNSIDSINPMFRRVGRLGCEIEVPIPSPSDRIEIFTKSLNEFRHSLQPSDVRTLAEKAHGYVGSDIAAVCKEAGRNALEKCLETQDCSEILLGVSDIEAGLKRVPPSAMRELVVQVPKVLWSDIGGNAEVKKKLKQTVEWPLKHPNSFARLGISPPSGVLMYGPPGCSKTLTAKALATESGLNFISIKGPELFSKYVGDSERAIRKIFAKARAASPSIIFIDELDALAGERSGKSSGTGNNVTDRVLATLLTELDGVEQRQDVIIVAATNRPDKIDKALLRPGRIDRIVHVPLPNNETRKDIFRIQFRRIPIASTVDIDLLVTKTEMYSGAEICAVCREAALYALERDMETKEVNQNDFEFALSAVVPQTSVTVVQMYEEYGKTLQLGLKE